MNINPKLWKKIKEQADVYSDIWRIGAAYKDGAEAMFAHLAPLVEWNDVKERLPEKEGDYLVKTLDGRFDVIKFLNLTKNMYWKCEVTHWRQIELIFIPYSLNSLPFP